MRRHQLPCTGTYSTSCRAGTSNDWQRGNLFQSFLWCKGSPGIMFDLQGVTWLEVLGSCKSSRIPANRELVDFYVELMCTGLEFDWAAV